MSLEIAIQENTTALQSLIALLSSGAIAQSAPGTPESPVETKTEVKTSTRTKNSTKDTAAKADEGKVASSDLANSKSIEQNQAIAKPQPKATVEEVQALVLTIAKDIGRDKAVELLGKFGAKKASDLKPEQFDDFAKAATAIVHGEAATESDDDLLG